MVLIYSCLIGSVLVHLETQSCGHKVKLSRTAKQRRVCTKAAISVVMIQQHGQLEQNSKAVLCLYTGCDQHGQVEQDSKAAGCSHSGCDQHGNDTAARSNEQHDKAAPYLYKCCDQLVTDAAAACVFVGIAKAAKGVMCMPHKLDHVYVSQS